MHPYTAVEADKILAPSILSVPLRALSRTCDARRSSKVEDRERDLSRSRLYDRVGDSDNPVFDRAAQDSELTLS
jgi:hypothetical protein